MVKKGPMASHMHRMGYSFQMTYNSNTKVLCPSDRGYVIISLMLILIPSGLSYLCIWLSDPVLVDFHLKIILSAVFSFFLFLCLFYLFRVMLSDPGILPSIYENSGIPSTERKRADNVREYYAEYLSKDDLKFAMDFKGVTDPTAQFFDFNKFKYLRMHYDDSENLIVDKKKKHNKLSYCDTCEHLRPPRAFHCAQCGVCVEVHDHHCPFVGNCIGYRNLKFFIAFLFWTSMLAFAILSLNIGLMVVCYEQMNDENQILYSATAKCLVSYSAVVGLGLFWFWMYQTFNLGIRNMTSNEDIRHRWNGHIRNKKATKFFRNRAGCCGRLKYILCADMTTIHGPSKLELYVEYVELYYKI